MDATEKALVQHKQIIIKAIKAHQYTQAASILQLALALSPDDVLLTELVATVQVKVQQDSSEGSSYRKEGSDAEVHDGTAASQQGCEQWACLSGKCSTDEEPGTETDGDSDDDIDTDDDADEEDGEHDDIPQQGVQHDSIVAKAAHLVTDATAACYADVQVLQHDLGCMAIADSGNTQRQCISGIRLAAECSTLTPQRRAALRQQLAAAIEEHKMACVQQRLVQDDPLLAASKS